MNKIILLVLLMLSSVQLLSQYTQEWVSRYNGTGNNADRATDIAVDNSGNVYVTGQSVGNGSGFDYYTIKYNSSGAVVWTKSYNGPGNSDDWAYSIAVDPSGNVYVTGGSRGLSSTFDDYATIKYDSFGNEQWVQRYNGSGNGNDIAASLAVDAAGNVYVTGYSLGNGSDNDYVTIKYTTAGNQEWAAIFNGSQNNSDRASSIAVDASGNVYVTGRSQWAGADQDYVTIKYNSSGTQIWGQLYDGPGFGYDEARSIYLDASGNVYVTGTSLGTGTGTGDYATIKYNSSGSQMWVSRYNGPGNSLDDAYSVASDLSGNVYVTGRSWGTTATGEDYLTIKYNSSGTEQWTQRFHGTGNGYDYAYAIALDVTGNSYVTGRSLGNGSGSDYVTIKYDPAGNEEWTVMYNGPANNFDGASSIAVDNTGNVYVTGQSTDIGPEEDYATIKYSQPFGIKPVSSELPVKFNLSQNYPNPFNPSTKIRFDIAKKGSVKIAVYDAAGRTVSVLVDENLEQGIYEVIWNAVNITSGVYFYRIYTDSYSETKKMIFIK